MIKIAVSTIYGPVPSWRLGRSLGIDPLLPPKTCTFDCIYCQLGTTVNKISSPESLKARVKVSKVLEDLKEALRRIALESIDYVTFSGVGEPTLNLELGEMITQVKKIVGKIPVAVLTNASLVNHRNVRENLEKADLIVAKLDAPNQRLFETINRPAKGLALDTIVEGLKALRREVHGKLALQIMFIESTDGTEYNTQPSDVEALIKLASAISPDEVEVNTPTRPLSEPYVQNVSSERIKEIAAKFERVLSGIKIVSRTSPTLHREAKKKSQALELEILGLLSRRPCNSEDLVRITGAAKKQVDTCLNQLMNSGSIASVQFDGKQYYRLASAKKDKQTD
ncbi:MAG: radical SAM protein [Candidatus Bathyarchaeia archaeon]